MWNRKQTDYVVVGSGIAGLTLSLLASRSGRVALVTNGSVGDGNSSIAQGGVAAAISESDSALLHTEDTIHAGHGLCEADSVQALISQAAEAIEFVRQLGVEFDLDLHGQLQLGKEGAHRHNRIIHAGGDATGRAIIDILIQHVRGNDRIECYEHTTALELLVQNQECSGLIAKEDAGSVTCFLAKAVVLATGGLGQLFKYTTNAKEVSGAGYAIAYRAGAVLRDMEFVQFHPTALKADSHPLPLVSEAVRGDGALLYNSAGERFMSRFKPWQELASRDVVARAIYEQFQTGHQVFLDARMIKDFPGRFPTIFASCSKIGVHPQEELIPVVPAAHYAMGGIQVDASGCSSIARLYAIGEVSSSGLHGANRLASNSLLEGLVMARQTAAAISTLSALPEVCLPDHFSEADFVKMHTFTKSSLKLQVQELMWKHAGIVRTESGLQEARLQLEEWLEQLAPHAAADRNLLITALLVVRAALWRKESRGGHYRADYPEGSETFIQHSLQSIDKKTVNGTPVGTALY